MVALRKQQTLQALAVGRDPQWYDELPKFHSKHKRRRLAVPSTHWRPELAQIYPEYVFMPTRVKEVMDGCDMKFPDPHGRVLNFAQTDASGGNIFPIVTRHREHYCHRPRHDMP